MWFGFKRSSLLEASKSEQEEAIERLILSSTMKRGYYLLLLLSTLLVTPGLLVNNAAVIIGGMILAPVIVPILLLALSILDGSLRGIIHSMKVIILSLILTVGLSSMLTVIFSRTYLVVEWIPDIIRPGIYLFIAFVSGIAAAFAWVKEDLAPTIAGVAIAVSLLPPICAVGIGFAFKDIPLVQNSSVLFVANFLGILVAAFLVFLVMGFLESGKMTEKVFKKSEKK
jgi:uncharacterized hydrophobic protein (TIGR00271 family)